MTSGSRVLRLWFVCFVLALLSPSRAPASGGELFAQSFDAPSPAEVAATIRAGCERCAWGDVGREAAALRVSLDGRYVEHLILARGAAVADYHVTIGAVERGRHRLAIDLDPALSAREIGRTTVSRVDVTLLDRSREEFLAQSMAPVLHARPNTVGKFTDLFQRLLNTRANIQRGEHNQVGRDSGDNLFKLHPAP